jgi:hypothetical protein
MALVQEPLERPRWLRDSALVAAGSLPLLALRAAAWSIVDWVTPFLFPAVELVAGLLFAAATLFALRRTSRAMRHPLAYAPLAVAVALASLIAFVPFPRLWLWTNFEVHRAAREAFVASLAQDPQPRMANELGDPWVERHANGTYVLFFTYRGVLDHYSGFLWVPVGGQAADFADLEDDGTQIVPWVGRWYFVAHR